MKVAALAPNHKNTSAVDFPVLAAGSPDSGRTAWRTATPSPSHEANPFHDAMRNRYDQTSKRIIRKAIEPGGDFTAEMEVSPDAQRFDGHFIPHAAHAAARRHRDLLDRMSARACTFEAFHVTPDPEQLMECVRNVGSRSPASLPARRRTRSF